MSPADMMRAALAAGLTQAEALHILHDHDAVNMAAHDGTIEAARSNYADDDCEIDDNPLLSIAADDSGVWVSAWVWVATNFETEEQESKT